MVSTNDRITSEVASAIGVSEETVAAIISHQFAYVREKAKDPTVSSIEITGMGRLMSHENLLPYMRKKLTNFLNAYKRRYEENPTSSLQKKISSTQEHINHLNIKIDGLVEDTGGIQE